MFCSIYFILALSSGLLALDTKYASHHLRTSMHHNNVRSLHTPFQANKTMIPTHKPVPSPTIRMPISEQPQPNLRRRTFVVRLQGEVFGHLNVCLSSIKRNVQVMAGLKSQCNRLNASSIGWQLLLQLQGIIGFLTACITGLKGCGRAPSPSALPYPTPSGPAEVPVSEICRVIFEIICQLKTACLCISSLAVRFPVVGQICQHTTSQIPNFICDLIKACQAHLRGLILPGLNQYTGGNPSAHFGGIGFGFSGVVSLLGSIL